MAHDSEKFILAGDVGGTKTFLGVFLERPSAPEPVKIEKFANADFASIEEVIEGFLASPELKGELKGGVCSATLGVAAPVVADRCTLTNMDWEIDGRAIKERLGVRRFALINDLAATGWGVGFLKDDDFFVLQRGVARPGNAALIAAGTGLGEAMLFYDGARHIPSASEGGHTDFAPRSALEMELLSYLAKRYGHVSYERVLSGPGLKSIYDFFRERGDGRGEDLEERFKAEEPAQVISSEALDGRDGDSKRALELFISLYGAEAGNLALKSLAVGGVYVGGGIAPRIIKAMKSSDAFMSSFTGKGRFEGLLKEVPVRVILNEKTALYGAALHASFEN
jgi:glucokinase